MKTVTLFLAQSFPPRPGVAARRLEYLVRESLKTSDRVFVIRLDRAYGKEISLKGLKVLPITARDLRSNYVGLSKIGTVRQTGRSKLFQLVQRLRQSFPFVYLTDDGGLDYRQKAFALASELVEKEGITHVISSFRPWSDHLVASQLKKQYPHLNWVADMRDLPVDPVRADAWWPGLQTWWGKRVLAAADEVWCVSRGQAEQLAVWHPVVKVRYNPLLTLPPGRTAPTTDRFTIVYTGSLYSGLQSIEPLVVALRKLLLEEVLPPHQLCLVYRGKDADLFRHWTAGIPTECLDVQTSIAPAAAQKMQEKAQVLLLLNWSAPGYYGVLTAKLWDYLASGRPILALVNGPGDEELRKIIEGAAAGAVFGASEQTKADEWLRAAIGTWQTTGTLAWETSIAALRAYV
ncbi:glycosyltransferase family 4 protein [Neolewinella antarctica]|uniref:Glycosyltransferase n=1 Tax=Neolewinella antarctica TaxID=442734 RepID=A0ABX0XB20_9BACT|nr:glycosyltransferase family 4 protein [Neolewinella antarctica]NJC26149.1 hypothetical protein [Neolewinella antarctica]